MVTSAQAGAREVAARVPPGSRVLAVGGPGVALSLQARGLVPVASAADLPAAVLMGYGPDVSWRELAEASYAVGAGIVADSSPASEWEETLAKASVIERLATIVDRNR